MFQYSYKCIGDDTKATARRSPNCIRKTKIKYGTEWFSIWRMEFFHPAMWHMALGSWHWIRPNVRHIGILLLSPQSTCGAPVCEIFIKIGLRHGRKITSCRFSHTVESAWANHWCAVIHLFLFVGHHQLCVIAMVTASVGRPILLQKQPFSNIKVGLRILNTDYLWHFI